MGLLWFALNIAANTNPGVFLAMRPKTICLLFGLPYLQYKKSFWESGPDLTPEKESGRLPREKPETSCAMIVVLSIGDASTESLAARLPPNSWQR